MSYKNDLLVAEVKGDRLAFHPSDRRVILVVGCVAALLASSVLGSFATGIASAFLPDDSRLVLVSVVIHLAAFLLSLGLLLRQGIEHFRKEVWVIDRGRDALYQPGDSTSARVSAISAIRVKGEWRKYRAQPVERVYFVSLEMIEGASPELGRWTQPKAVPVIQTLVEFLQVPVIEKGLPLNDISPAPANL